MRNQRVTEFLELILRKYPTQGAFADALGMHRQTISRYVLGQREPNIRVLARFAEQLDCSLEEIALIFLRYWSPKRCSAKK